MHDYDEPEDCSSIYTFESATIPFLIVYSFFSTIVCMFTLRGVVLLKNEHVALKARFQEEFVNRQYNEPNLTTTVVIDPDTSMRLGTVDDE